LIEAQAAHSFLPVSGQGTYLLAKLQRELMYFCEAFL
jgi:hypothetical protein